MTEVSDRQSGDSALRENHRCMLPNPERVHQICEILGTLDDEGDLQYLAALDRRYVKIETETPPDAVVRLVSDLERRLRLNEISQRQLTALQNALA